MGSSDDHVDVWHFSEFVIDNTDGYLVNYDANGGGGTTGSTTIDRTSLQSTLAANAFSREGYGFKEWNDKADGTGTAYAQKREYVFEGVTSDITLYAQWTPITYDVEFDANGGKGTMAKQQHTYDQTRQLTKKLLHP